MNQASSTEAIGLSPDGRLIFKLWTTKDNSALVLVEAWRSNHDKNVFFVPSLGFTTSLNGGLFEHLDDAYTSALKDLKRQQEVLNRRMSNLEASHVGYQTEDYPGL